MKGMNRFSLFRSVRVRHEGSALCFVKDYKRRMWMLMDNEFHERRVYIVMDK
jgi:hypothetical protein